MNAVPILRRELLVLARRRWFHWLRTGAGAAFALLGTVVFVATAGSAATPAGLGGPLFHAVTTISYLLCLLAGPVFLADSVAGEKAAGTLGLLLLTNTRSHDIVGGKFVASALPALHCLLAALPVLAIAFFLGGVTAGEFARTAAALLNALGFSLAVGVACSVVARTGRRAFAAALLLVLLCGAALPAVTMMAGPGGAVPGFVRWLGSPGLGLWHAREDWLAPLPAAAGPYQTAMGWTLALAALALFVAVAGLPFCWREGIREASAPVAVRARRARAAAADPVLWLAQQRLGRAGGAWAMAGVMIAVIGGLTVAAQGGARTGIEVLLAAYALHAVFKVWVGWVASRAFGTERDSGALELLLVTPLGDAVVWRAWLAALRRRFLVPALAVGGCDLLLAWLAAFHWPDGVLRQDIFFLTFLAVIIFLLDCYALCWAGLWNGLVAVNATRATIRTLLGWLAAPGVLFVTVVLGAAQTGTLDADSLRLYVVLWAVASFLLDVVAGALSMVRLSHDSREAAARVRGKLAG